MTRSFLLHLDDVGSSAGSVTAWTALRNAGVVRSASVMVPCPWYRAAVANFHAAPDQDLGIHITLTSEWDAYRWRPMTGPVAGLVDDEGFFHRRPQAVAANADPRAVEDEMAAQIERALADGIRPTHIDAHMGTAFLAPFMEKLWGLAGRYRLPVPLCRDPSALASIVRLDGLDDGYAREMIAEAESRGDPVFDSFLIGFAPEGGSVEAFYRAMVENAAPGLHFLAMHANAPGDVPGFAPHMAWPREGEYALFSDAGAARVLFDAPDIRTVNWHDLAAEGGA